jgi:hypothetical protein
MPQIMTLLISIVAAIFYYISSRLLEVRQQALTGRRELLLGLGWANAIATAAHNAVKHLALCALPRRERKAPRRAAQRCVRPLCLFGSNSGGDTVPGQGELGRPP